MKYVGGWNSQNREFTIRTDDGSCNFIVNDETIKSMTNKGEICWFEQPAKIVKKKKQGEEEEEEEEDFRGELREVSGWKPSIGKEDMEDMED